DDAFGPRFGRAPQASEAKPRKTGAAAHDEARRVQRWNEIAIDASGLDHTPVAADEARTFGEQLGPGRASRAMAIVHIAIFDAVNAIARDYESYTGLPAAPAHTSMNAAIAQAAHDALAALYPAQRESFAERLAEDLAELRPNRATANGGELGQRPAAGVPPRRPDHGSRPAGAPGGVRVSPRHAPGAWA